MIYKEVHHVERVQIFNHHICIMYPLISNGRNFDAVLFATFHLLHSLNYKRWLWLEMVHFTGDIYEKLVPQHLLPFYLSKIFHFSRQKLVLR